MQRWHRCIIWQVKHRLTNGEIDVKWFKREEAARDFAKMLASADVIAVKHTVRDCQKYGLMEDQIRHVVNA
jgi:hypothetical protein